MLLTSIFSCSHIVSKPTKELKLICNNSEFFSAKVLNLSSGKGLTYYHTMLHFDSLKIYSCRKLCEKKRYCLQQASLLFSQCFLPYMVLIFHFKCTLKCCLQFVSIWTDLKFSRLVMG